jgi:hypothetical protein
MSTSTVSGQGEGWKVPGYAEERELGHGASGRVVEAVQQATGRRAAIKYLSPDLVHDQDFLERFRTQALRLRDLDVPHIVQVYDFAEQPGHSAAVVMELVSGASLRAMIEHQGPMRPEAALAVLKGSLLGLAAVHRLGFGHRDVKPGNVLVDTAGQVKLTDFGLPTRAAGDLPAAGTPQYLAPERWEGEPASPATDVYAATAVFFECLTGAVPFSGDLAQLPEQHANAAVPLDRIDAPLQPLILRGLEKERTSRPHSANAFVSELEALAAAAYGADWEERGRGQLADRARALRPLGRGGPGDGPWRGRRPPAPADDHRLDRGRRHRGGRRGHGGHADVWRAQGKPERFVVPGGGGGHAVVQGGGERDATGGGVEVRDARRLRLQCDALGDRPRNGQVSVGVLLRQTGPGADGELPWCG